ncbi:MAG TPA: hypothetical protein VLG67_01755 [Candidatus Saccharimonadales bacterium]|nr:hypothetical protein [Candidatus Saccharimonadales bacterium]
MQNSITIYGTKTLDRYTKLILIKGFENNSWDVTEGILGKNFTTPYFLYQIHGAPQAVDEDKILINMIRSTPPETKMAILLHRPDELQERHPKLKEILSNMPENAALVFSGNLHAKDEFYKNVKKKFIIPHGFFEIKEIIQTDPIIIGTQTTWGEMRSVNHALRIILEVFRLNNSKTSFVGYLGGKPSSELQINNLKQISKKINPDIEIEFLGVEKYSPTEALKEFPEKNIILIDTENKEPETFGITFNIQTYYYGERIRTGESSGSLHMTLSIPVILEMNGSEKIEDLQVIKIPYGSLSDIRSADFEKGAKMIIETINNGSFRDMLEHNLKQARKFNNTFVARSYIDILNQI